MVKRFRPGSYEYIIRFRFRFDGSVNTRYHVLKGISNYTGNKTGNISHASSRQINSPNKFVTLSIRSTISWSRLPSIQQFHFVYTSYKISTRSKNKTNNTRPIDRENPSLTVLSRFSLPLDLLPPWLHRRYPICGRGNNHASTLHGELVACLAVVLFARKHTTQKTETCRIDLCLTPDAI